MLSSPLFSVGATKDLIKVNIHEVKDYLDKLMDFHKFFLKSRGKISPALVCFTQSDGQYLAQYFTVKPLRDVHPNMAFKRIIQMTKPVAYAVIITGAGTFKDESGATTESATIGIFYNGTSRAIQMFQMYNIDDGKVTFGDIKSYELDRNSPAISGNFWHLDDQSPDYIV